MRALTDTAATILACSDEYAIALTEAYREAVSDRLVSTDRHRSALVEALVTGGVSDHGPAWEVAKLSAGGSATAAGQALFCHPNTVRYRLRRVEELTGRSVGVRARPPS